MATDNIQNKTIKVFISSIFNDLQEERDELVKNVFPILREKCQKAGLVFSEVDLRWGITNEESADNQVLNICLEEIENCNPFFIGIIGNRYGWIPEEIPSHIMERYEWLQEFKEKSVTEIEIIHALRKNELTPENHCFFYLKESKGSNTEVNPKLLKLKDTIRNSNSLTREDFASPKELGESVLSDLLAAIEPIIENSENQNEINEIKKREDNYLKLKSKNIVSQPDTLDFLSKAIKEETEFNNIIILRGEKGCGKSTSLMDWYIKSKDSDEDTQYIYYPTHAHVDFSDVCYMMQYLSWKLKDCPADFTIDKEKNRYDITEEFYNLLEEKSEEKKLVIIIPAIDTLSDALTGGGLIWLQKQNLPNVSFVLSSGKKEVTEDLKMYEALYYSPEPLDSSHITAFTNSYLKEYSKRLDKNLLETISQAELCKIPINLQIILEEIRLFGKHEELETTVKDYIECKDSNELFIKVIERWEKDYNTDEYPNLVEEALTSIIITLLGLSDNEIRQILGKDTFIPQSVWTPLRIAITPWLTNNDNKYLIRDMVFAKAIMKKYLHSKELVTKAHSVIVDLYKPRWINKEFSKELIVEYPYACVWSQRYDEFKAFYSDKETLNHSAASDIDLTVQNLGYLQEHNFGHYSELLIADMTEEEAVIKAINENPVFIGNAADICKKMNDLHNAKSLYYYMADQGSKTKNDKVYLYGISGLASIAMIEGETDHALHYYNLLLDKYYEENEMKMIGASFQNIGLVYYLKEEYEEALKYYDEGLHYFSEAEEIKDMIATLINISNTHERMEDWETALEKLQEALELSQNFGMRYKTAIIHDEIGTIIRKHEQYELALQYHNSALSIFQQYSDNNSFAVSLAKRASCLMGIENEIGNGIYEFFLALDKCLENGYKQDYTEILKSYNATLFDKLSEWKSMGMEQPIITLIEVSNYISEQEDEDNQARKDMLETLEKYQFIIDMEYDPEGE